MFCVSLSTLNIRSVMFRFAMRLDCGWTCVGEPLTSGFSPKEMEFRTPKLRIQWDLSDPFQSEGISFGFPCTQKPPYGINYHHPFEYKRSQRRARGHTPTIDPLGVSSRIIYPLPAAPSASIDPMDT